MLFLCLCDLVSKGTPQGYYAKLRRLEGGKSTAYSSQTVFHNVCLEHAVLFLCLCDLVSKGTPQGYYAKLRRLGGGKTAIDPLRNGIS